MTDLFILMTTAEADAVRGETSPGAWLAPVPLADGTSHILPERVLWDPEHAPAHARLESLPRAPLPLEMSPAPD